MPPMAMLAAAEVYLRTKGLEAVLCAKFDHGGIGRCIFNCRFGEIGLSGGTVERDRENIEVTKHPQDFGVIAGLF